MFERHDEIDAGGDPPARLRVLAVAQDESAIIVIDTSKPECWPYAMEADVARSLVASDTWRLSRGQPIAHPLDHELTPAALARRNANWELIAPIVEDEVALFHRMSRARLVTVAVKASGKARTTIDGLLLLYLHGGMCRAALTPSFSRCGAPGIARPAAPEAPKRGAPTAPGAPSGVNVTPEIRQSFALAVSLSFAREKRHDLASAYQLFLRRFCMKEERDPATGAPKHVSLPPYDLLGLPSERQFRYWVGKDQDLEALSLRRMKPRQWETRRRPLLGNPTAHAIGPCSRFQIDATVLDVVAVSRRIRRLIVGRPTLYVVIDTFSRMIVGIYIGLEPPSWVAAMMALANAAADKVEFCRSIGIEIEPHEWPARHVPGAVAGDRGEMIAAGVERMLLQFNVRIANAASYRADWKPEVEIRFRMLPALFRPYVPGYVEKDLRQRGEPDHRLGATLDIDDLHKIIVPIVLYYNNHHVLQDYVRHPGLTADGVPSIPADLFEWGIANLSGVPRQPTLDRFHFALMPAGEASVTPQGIAFGGRLYTSDEAVQRRWFTRARDRRFKLAVSHDPRLTDYIYVHDRERTSGYHVARLTERSRNRAGLTLVEAALMDEEDRLLHASLRTQQAIAHADATARIERTVAEARDRQEEVPDGRSARARVRSIRAARAAERSVDRLAEAEAFRRAMALQAPPRGELVPFPGPPAEASYRAPTLEERRRRRAEQDQGAIREGDDV